MLEIEDTPWYPTMRLFRQKKSGDWKTVMNTVAEEVRKLVTQKQQGIPLSFPIKNTDYTSEKYAGKNNDHSAIPTSHTSSHTSVKKQALRAPLHTTESIPQNHTAAIKNTIAQFKEVNIQLSDIEAKLKECTCSVYNERFLELTRKAYIAHNMHLYLKKQLSSLTHTS